MQNEAHVPIVSSLDIVAARQKGRTMATEMGFDSTDVTVIAAAISEVSRNIVEYAEKGEIMFQAVRNNAKSGLCIVARDHGPGIADVERAMNYGYSTGRGLGVGLPGAKRLMDEFVLESKVGVGTTVTMKKWLRHHGK